MIRILIADDHMVVRWGLKKILLDEFPSAYIDECEDAETLLNKVIREKWDLIVADLTMPGRPGIEALQQIKRLYPKLPILVLSGHSEEEYAVRVLKAGASGYINKEAFRGTGKSRSSHFAGEKIHHAFGCRSTYFRIGQKH